MTDDHTQVVVVAETTTLVVPHIGFTLRTLLAAACSGYKTNPKRVWKVSFQGTVIGSVRIANTHLKGDSNARHENGVAKRVKRTDPNPPQDSDAAYLGVDSGQSRPHKQRRRNRVETEINHNPDVSDAASKDAGKPQGACPQVGCQTEATLASKPRHARRVRATARAEAQKESSRPCTSADTGTGQSA